jgi:hypothetical protein
MTIAPTTDESRLTPEGAITELAAHVYTSLDRLDRLEATLCRLLLWISEGRISNLSRSVAQGGNGALLGEVYNAIADEHKARGIT